MANAKRAKREDVYREAFRRLCELEGLDQNDPLHRDFYATLRAYEELLTEKNERTTKASRTRQKLARHGVIKCLEDWASDSKETQGFVLLVNNNMVELTGEYLVVKYADHFSPATVESARKRLATVRNRQALAAALDAIGIKA
jgi:hypothetical protein